MKIISYIFGIFFLAMILCSFSCSPQTDDSGSSINIFKPPKDIRDRNNTRGRGVLKPDIVTMKKSMRNVQEENDSETLFAYLATIIGLIALIVIAVLFERYMRYRMDTTADSPAALFMELCLAHRLTRMERNLIERVAEASDIDNPLPVFLDPQYLAKSSNDNKFITSRQNIEYLLGKLFDNKSESDTTYITKRSSILTP
ncbi:MAG: hypothetical protein LBQ66_05630, partial [Planctomycetaceae bacterium]|nr:hypothetical protein [Planctomycetaceae bacterium]